MPSLSQVAVSMPRSGIRELMDLASTMSDVIHLEIGEPSFDTPPHIVEAAARALREGYTRYTSNAGLLSLREKLVRKLEQVNGIRVSPDSIVVTPGAVCALASAVATLVGPGDEVLIPNPGWPNYGSMVSLVGGIPKLYLLNESDGFLPDLALLEEQIGPRTRAILVNTPSNPAGAVYPRNTVEGLLELARRHDLFVISDEVYEAIVFDGEHVSAPAFDTDGRVAAIYGFSKSYAMTGWRLGYLVASEEVAAVAGKLQEPLVSCAPAVSQKAGEAALDGPQDCVEAMRSAYQRRRDMAADLLTELGVPFSRPRGAFYLLAEISASGMDSYSFARAFLREARVAVAPGETFGPATRDYVRLSLATADDLLAEGIRRLAAVLKG